LPVEHTKVPRIPLFLKKQKTEQPKETTKLTSNDMKSKS